MSMWVRFNLRLPRAVHSELAKSAKAGGRSVNAEIVERLNRSVGGVFITPDEIAEAGIAERFVKLEERVAELEKWKRAQSKSQKS